MFAEHFAQYRKKVNIYQMCMHVYSIHTCTCTVFKIKYLPIEGVSIVSDKDIWLDVKNVLKESPQQRRFVRFVEDNERPLVLGLWGVLKIFNVSSNNFTICDQVTLEWESEMRKVDITAKHII